MPTKTIIFLLILFSSLSFFAYSVFRLLRMLRIGKPENRFDKPWTRVKKMMVVAIGQSKILREPAAGIMHALIFWGFVVLLAAVLESIGEGIVQGFSFRVLGALYRPLVFLEDLFSGLVILSVLYALFRRGVLKPKRLAVDLH